MNVNVTLEDLRNAIPNLSDHFRASAQDLLVAFDRNGGALTVRQWHFAAQMVGWAKERAERQARVPEKVIGYERVLKLFEAATSAGLMFPKVRVTPDIVLRPAGAGSAHPGAIQVKTTEGAWLGRINADGTLVRGSNMDGHTARILLAWAKDPAVAAKAYGSAYGSCCFCGKHLTDGRSVAMGYGPVCADKYGLGWGAVKVETEVEVSEVVA